MPRVGVVRAVLVALAGLVAPGFAQGLMRQRVPQWIAFGAMAVALALLAVTTWAVVLVVVVWLGTLIDAGLRYRRLRGTIGWSWLDPLLSFAAALVLQVGLRLFVIEAFKAPSSSMLPTIEIGDHFMINKLAGTPSRGDIIVFRHPCQPDRDYFKRVIALGGDTVEIRCSVLYLNGAAVKRELIDAHATYTDRDDQAEYVREVRRYRETLDDVTYEVFGTTSEPPTVGDFPDMRAVGCLTTDTPLPTSLSAGPVVETAPDETDPCKPQRHFVVPEGSVFVLGDNRGNSNDSRSWGVVPVDHIRGRAVGIWYPLSRLGGVQ